MAMTADQLLDVYEQQLKNRLDEENAETDALLALLTRDSLADLSASLSEQQEQRLALLDEELNKRQQIAAQVLPNYLSTDRKRWWWFLHEGPQVREKAEVA